MIELAYGFGDLGEQPALSWVRVEGVGGGSGRLEAAGSGLGRLEGR